MIDRCKDCMFNKLKKKSTCPQCNGIAEITVQEDSLVLKCKKCNFSVATYAERNCITDDGKFSKEKYSKMQICEYAKNN